VWTALLRHVLDKPDDGLFGFPVIPGWQRITGLGRRRSQKYQGETEDIRIWEGPLHNFLLSIFCSYAEVNDFGLEIGEVQRTPPIPVSDP
jgi:hypothetical protein